VSGVTVANATAATTAGTVTTAAQPNITSVGTLTSLTVGGNILPNANVTYNLGSPTARFKDLYLSNNTIYMGNASISANGNAISMTTANGTSVTVTTGGSNTQVQFNDAGNFAGASTFTFDKTSNTLSIANLSVTTTSNLGAVGNVKITGGTSGQFLSTNGNGTLSWATASGGGNGSPGGSNTQVQFNNAGSFGGSANFTFDGNNVVVTGSISANTFITTGTGSPNYTSSADFVFNTGSNVGALVVYGTVQASKVLTLTPQTSAPTAATGSFAVALPPGWDPATKGGTTPYPVFYNGTTWTALY
jgi:hypothetical protein